MVKKSSFVRQSKTLKLPKDSFVMLNWQYRIYPNSSQKLALNSILETCRIIYNRCVSLAKLAYYDLGVTLSAFDLINKLRFDKIGTTLYSNVRNDIARRYERSRDRLFKGLSKPPKYKNRKNYNSFTYVETGFDVLENVFATTNKTKNKHLHLSKLFELMLSMGLISIEEATTLKDAKTAKNEAKLKSLIRMRQHRAFPRNCVIKNATIIRKNSGKWFVNFAIEIPTEEFFKRSRTAGNNKAVGIDPGLESFITLSDGTKIEPPKFLKQHLKQLQHMQRILSRKYEAAKKAALSSVNKDGNRNRRKSANYQKQSRKLVLLHEHIANMRKDFLMKLAHWLVNNFDYIMIEDLKAMFMLANHKLAKSAADASFGMFKQFLAYQAYKHQTKLVLVDPKYTTQDCSVCGYRIKKPLNVRVHECPRCGVVIDRDINAAINILHKGAKELPASNAVYCVAIQELRWDSANVKLPENGASVLETKSVSSSSDVCERRSHSL